MWILVEITAFVYCDNLLCIMYGNESFEMLIFES